MAVEGFRFSVRQEVSPRDLDGFGHVNNAVYLTYMENARVAYLREVLGVRRLEDVRNVMASVTVEFKAPASFGDVLEVAVRCEQIGGKSFGLRYAIVGADGTTVATATSAQVMFDFATQQSIPVPPAWRCSIETYDRQVEAQ
ncbi:MAG: acyl-CoA thioesterase [Actinobacteria bacterium]|nr:acyl-CoA thioesterase [Actinomycetota bacterium]